MNQITNLIESLKEARQENLNRNAETSNSMLVDVFVRGYQMAMDHAIALAEIKQRSLEFELALNKLNL